MAPDPAQDNRQMTDTIRSIFNSSVAPISCSSEMEFIQAGFTFNKPHYTSGYNTKFYRARHEQSGHLVMKTMNLTELKPYRKKQFLMESCKILDYVGKKEAIANVVRVFGLFLIGDTLYVFMRHYSERSIHYKMRMVARFKESLVQRWLKQLGSVCEYLHKKGIVHRSIRVEHLLLDEQNNLHLTGWTRSIFLLNPITGLLNKCTREYRCLKQNHLPPECFIGSEHSPAQIDQWSFGVMMVALATNRHLFKPKEQTRNNLEQQWKQFFLKHGAMLSPKVVFILDKLFRMQVDDRVSLDTILKVDYFAESKELSTALQSTTKPQTRKDFPSASSNRKPPTASKQPKFQPTSLKSTKSRKSKGTTSPNRKTSPKSLVMSSSKSSNTKGSNSNWIQVDSSSSHESSVSKEDNKKSNISTIKPKSRDLKVSDVKAESKKANPSEVQPLIEAKLKQVKDMPPNDISNHNNLHAISNGPITGASSPNSIPDTAAITDKSNGEQPVTNISNDQADLSMTPSSTVTTTPAIVTIASQALSTAKPNVESDGTQNSAQNNNVRVSSNDGSTATKVGSTVQSTNSSFYGRVDGIESIMDDQSKSGTK